MVFYLARIFLLCGIFLSVALVDDSVQFLFFSFDTEFEHIMNNNIRTITNPHMRAFILVIEKYSGYIIYSSL